MTNARMVGRRIRAAMSLADRTTEDVAAELDVSVKTLLRTIRGERTARGPELERLAEILDVPVAFLHQGLQGSLGTLVGPAATADRLRQVTELRRALQREERALAGHARLPREARP